MEIEWMWADAGGPFRKIAVHNPLRWSLGSVDRIVRELLAESVVRPVRIRTAGSDSHGQVFDDPRSAALWACERYVDLRVRFQVRCGTKPDQFVVAAGVPQELGVWSPVRGLRLSTTAEDYPIWTSEEISCASFLTRFEYKFVVCSKDGAARWEDGPPRSAALLGSLRDLGEPGTVTIIDSSVGMTARPPQVRFEPTAPGPLTTSPCSRASSLRRSTQQRATPQAESCDQEVLNRSQWSFTGAASSFSGHALGSFGTAHFPRMVWDHRSASDTAQIDVRYKLGTKIGQGTFGIVRKAALNHGGSEARVRAVKQVRKDKIGDTEDFNREVRIMELMDHQNALRLFEVFEDHRYVYLVTELCEGGDLLRLMLETRPGGCKEPEAAHLLRQMAAALSHCHRQGVAHRDVKLENFLILEPSRSPRECQVKLCDMGLADREPPGGFTKACGSFSTLAPEVLMVAAGGPPYRVSCDLWSLGSVLYSMLSCNIAQGPEVGEEIGRDWRIELKRGRYNMQCHPWPHASPEACDLVRSLMCLDVTKRLSAEGCRRHPWLSQDGPNKSLRAPPVISFGTAEKLSQGLNRWFGQCRLGHFRKTALHVLAQQGGASGHLREAFRSLDRNKDGQVSLRQLVDVLATILPGGEENAAVREWRQSILPVLPEDAALGQTEFLAATMSAEVWLEEDRCWDVFRFFDRDRDGTISMEDLERAFPGAEARAKCGFKREMEELGGRITFARFVQLMRESVQSAPADRNRGGGADSGAGEASVGEIARA